MKGISLLLALWALFLDTSAQETEHQKKIRKNAFQLQAGAEVGYFKDKNFSPLNYSNNGVALRLGYQRELNKEHQLFATINTQG